MRYILIIILAFLSTGVYTQDKAPIDCFTMPYNIQCTQSAISNNNDRISSMLNLANDINPQKADTAYIVFFRNAYFNLPMDLFSGSIETSPGIGPEGVYDIWKYRSEISAFEFYELVTDSLKLGISYDAERTAIEETLPYAKSSIDRIDLKRLYYASYYYEAMFCIQQKHYQDAIDKLHSSYEYCLSMGILKDCHTIAFKLHELLHYMGNYLQSGKMLCQGLQHLMEIKDYETVIVNLSMLSRDDLSDYSKEILLDLDDITNKLLGVSNISPYERYCLNTVKGNLYFQEGNSGYDLAEMWFNNNSDWIKSKTELMDIYFENEHYSNLADLFYLKNDTLKAINYLSKSIEINKSKQFHSLRDSIEIVSKLVKLSELYKGIGEDSQSNCLLTEAYDICNTVDDRNLWALYWLTKLSSHLYKLCESSNFSDNSDDQLEQLTEAYENYTTYADTTSNPYIDLLIYYFDQYYPILGVDKREQYYQKIVYSLYKPVVDKSIYKILALEALIRDEIKRKDELKATQHAQLLYNLIKNKYKEYVLYQIPRFSIEFSPSILSEYSLSYFEDSKIEFLSNSMSELGFNESQLIKSFLLKRSMSLQQLLSDKGTPEDQQQYNEIQKSYLMKSKAIQSAKLTNNEILEIDSKIAILESGILHMANSYGDYSGFLDTDFQWVKQTLTQNEYLLDFASIESYSGGNTYTMFLMDNEGIYPKQFYAITDEELINNGIETSLDFYDPITMEILVKVIWYQLAPHISPGATIYYIPTHKFYQIDLASLVMPDGTLLGDHYHIVRLSSVDQLKKRKAKLQFADHTDNEAVILGGLSYDMTEEDMLAEIQKHTPIAFNQMRSSLRGNALSYLPQTKKEAESIEQLLKDKGFNTHLLTGKTGTAESFYDINGHAPQVLHIATHGFYYLPDDAQRTTFFKGMEDAMDLSGLAFAGANAAWTGKEIPEGVHPGIVTASEIAAMDLTGLELVVLSACQTGEGKTTNEGLYGLQRSFKKAGAGTIIMSLWPVSDRITREFMEKFYRNLLDNRYHGDKHRAFQATKNEIRERYPDPIYWAAFVMTD